MSNAVDELNFEEIIMDVDTTDLSGEKIERLLFEAGFDTELTTGVEGLPVLLIKGDSVEFAISEPWASDGNWYIDPATIVLDVMVDGQVENTVFPSVDTEEALVEAVENLSESL